ncbi:hypothetical protein LZC95_52715 [Pendulispora brunnea]|uniref:Fibronectin type-III domain-containing protein n=1 Tax=Pendulispora brunnea TaxID=2905690 RepID=A0ABZ2KAG8_9BACT
MRTFFSLLLRTLVAVCIGALTWSFTADAYAQSLTFTAINVTRVKPDGSNAPSHPSGVPNNTLTRDDCIQDVSLRLSLTVAGTPDSSHNLEAWGGGGTCDQVSARTPNTATCGRVRDLIGGASVRVGTLTVDIRVQDIADQQSAASKNAGPYKRGTAAACDAQTTSGPQSTNVYLLWLTSPSAEQQGLFTQPVTIDMRGPPGPTGITAGEGDRVVKLNWTATQNAGTEGVQGYKVYCAPVADIDAAPAPVVDAGDAGPPACEDGGFTDGGFDDAGNPIPGQPIDGGCAPPVSDGGGGSNCPKPPLNECATAGGAISNGTTVKGLTNGTYYSFAVAAYNKSQNVGAVSDPVCATPGPVADFFYQYRRDGGEAGGCALEGAPVANGVTIAGASVIGIALLRRRRKGKRS